MKENTKQLTFCYLLFLLMLALVGYLEGVISDFLYYAAFLVPSALALHLSRGRRGDGEEKLYLGLKLDGAKLLSVLISPTVFAVWGLSYLTALLIYVTTGATDTVDVGSSFPLAVITTALVPALCEELLFRYLPMRLIAPYSRARAVWLSAVFFAVAHLSPFSLVYALVAGVIFMVADIAAESIWPSVILHFINNFVNLIMIFYPSVEVKIGVIVSLCLLFAITLPIFILNRRKIISAIKSAFDKGEQAELDPTPLLFIIPAVVVGASLLF